MAYILGKNSVAITVPAGQSIRIGNFRGMPMQLLTVEPGRVNGPIVDIPAQNITYGSYSAATQIVLVNNGFDAVEYVVSASPGLIDAQYNPYGVDIRGGTINGTSIGATTRANGQFTDVRITATDSTGTPGNVTNNSGNGRAAFAAAGTTVVVTNSLCSVNDSVHVTLLGAADATLTNIVGVTVAAGSFTVRGNAAATATKGFMFTIIKQ